MYYVIESLDYIINQEVCAISRRRLSSTLKFELTCCPGGHMIYVHMCF